MIARCFMAGALLFTGLLAGAFGYTSLKPLWGVDRGQPGLRLPRGAAGRAPHLSRCLDDGERPGHPVRHGAGGALLHCPGRRVTVMAQTVGRQRRRAGVGVLLHHQVRQRAHQPAHQTVGRDLCPQRSPGRSATLGDVPFRTDRLRLGGVSPDHRGGGDSRSTRSCRRRSPPPPTRQFHGVTEWRARPTVLTYSQSNGEGNTWVRLMS